MHKSKSSKGKAKARWGEFSEWVWNEDQRLYFRVRQDAEGNYDYEYNAGGTEGGNVSSEPQSGIDPVRTPKYTDPVEEITAGVSNLSPNSGTYESDYQVSSSSQRTRDKPKSSKSRDYRAEQGSEDDPEVQGRTRPSRGYHQSVEEDSDPQYTYSSGGQAARTGTAYHGRAYEPANVSSSSQAAAVGYDYDSYEYDPYEQQRSGGQYAYASSSNAAPSSAYEPYSNYEPEDEGGRSTPRAGHRHMPHITADASEALDPRYRVEKSERFQPGEIFKASYAEQKGAVNGTPVSVSGQQEMQDQYGVTFYTGFRRFIVIANDAGHCTCVPIMTYGGKACTKKGVKPEKHGIIYQRGQRAKPLEREPKLGFPPVKMDITTEGERISKESRVNYSKLVTVEHNVKVMFIGSITENDWLLVHQAINACWAQKTHHKKKGFK